MRAISILNQVIGPIMRGPSSSHTAGAFHIAQMARSILGVTPNYVRLTFDRLGSYAATYQEQGADRAFAMGFLGKPLTHPTFFNALDDAASAGIELEFVMGTITSDSHPNAMAIELETQQNKLNLQARSIGGGEVEITQIDHYPVLMRGIAFEVLCITQARYQQSILTQLNNGQPLLSAPEIRPQPDAPDVISIFVSCATAVAATTLKRLRQIDPELRFYQSQPVYFVQKGRPLINSAAEIVTLCKSRNCSLGELALEHESALLGVDSQQVMHWMLERYNIMQQSVVKGLDPKLNGLQFMPSSAHQIFQAEAEGRLPFKSMHTRAAARALAVMHVDATMGVVCAAPTGGSAGVLPAVLVTIVEERKLSFEQIARALMAAGAIGLVLAQRATFAAEAAGCQVEIGASGAMAAAALVELAGGNAEQACDAAAISFQNTMGTVCDLLHGTVEIPCHTRNAAAAASAFVNADLILGGYHNAIPLDETIDAVYAVGKSMPSELRCTSRGGLAVTPSALALHPKHGCYQCSTATSKTIALVD